MAEKETKQPEVTVELLQEINDNLVKENEEIIKELELIKEENEKLTKTAKRLQSSADNSDKFRDQLVALKTDFDSYRKRIKADQANSKLDGMATVITEILPVLDTFELAKQHLNEKEIGAYTMVENQLVKALTGLGLVKIEPLGQEFDVDTMNALTTIDKGEDNTNKVVEVYKNGYEFNEKIIRFAEVIVGK